MKEGGMGNNSPAFHLTLIEDNSTMGPGPQAVISWLYAAFREVDKVGNLDFLSQLCVPTRSYFMVLQQST